MRAIRFAVWLTIPAIACVLNLPSQGQAVSAPVSGPISQPIGRDANGSNSDFATTPSTQMVQGAGNLVDPDVRVISMDPVGSDITITAMNPLLDRSTKVPNMPVQVDNSQPDAPTMTGAHQQQALSGLASRGGGRNAWKQAAASSFMPVTLPASTFSITSFKGAATAVSASSFQPAGETSKPFQGQSYSPDKSSGLQAQAMNSFQATSVSMAGMKSGPNSTSNSGSSERQADANSQSLNDLQNQALTSTSILLRRNDIKSNLFASSSRVSVQQAENPLERSESKNYMLELGSLDEAPLFKLSTLSDDVLFSPDVLQPAMQKSAGMNSVENRALLGRESRLPASLSSYASRLNRLSAAEMGSSDIQDLANYARRENSLTNNRNKYALGSYLRNKKRAKYHNPLLEREQDINSLDLDSLDFKH
jgi:hypothetical protein